MAKMPHAAADTQPPAMDYPMIERTYSGFMVFLKWSIISVVVLLVLLYFLIIA